MNTAGDIWQCPKCKRWQSHDGPVCRSEYDTGMACDGVKPVRSSALSPAAGTDRAAEGWVSVTERDPEDHADVLESVVCGFPVSVRYLHFGRARSNEGEHHKVVAL